MVESGIETERSRATTEASPAAERHVRYAAEEDSKVSVASLILTVTDQVQQHLNLHPHMQL